MEDFGAKIYKDEQMIDTMLKKQLQWRDAFLFWHRNSVTRFLPIKGVNCKLTLLKKVAFVDVTTLVFVISSQIVKARSEYKLITTMCTEMGLVRPNPKLSVPRSEVFMIVWENQIGQFSP